MHSGRNQMGRRALLLAPLGFVGALLLMLAGPARAATVTPIDNLGDSRTNLAVPTARIPIGGALKMVHQPNRRETREKSTAGEPQHSPVDHRSDGFASGIAVA